VVAAWVQRMTDFDVVVVGGGPAGLSAAIEISQRGGQVLVVDENPRLGGKLLGQLHQHPKTGWWRGQRIAANLVERAERAGVHFRTQTQVWALQPGWRVHVSDLMNRDGFPGLLSAKTVLIAAGAVEKSVPVPGWTLPGVMTIGAAQVLTNVYGVQPGRRVIISGVDPLSITVAHQLRLCGVDVVGIVLPFPTEFSGDKSLPKAVLEYVGTMTHLAPHALLRQGGALLRHPALLKLALRCFPAGGIRIWGIPLQLRTALVGVHGEKQVEAVTIQKLSPAGNFVEGTGKTIEVDAVCLSGGLSPLLELAVAAGCRFATIPELGGAVPLHGGNMETTVENLFVAGNITGIEGAKVAIAQGTVAGIGICRKLGLGRVTDDEIARASQHVEEERAQSDIQFYPNAVQGRRKLAGYYAERKMHDV